jgi:CheY-like chemotaxis protein
VKLSKKSAIALPDGRYIKTTITDGGGGISEGLATKIFDPYFTTKPAGSGLGLSISYSIIKKHGGILTLESSSPRGSTFAFYLPAMDGPLPKSEPPVVESLLHFHNQRVLVMDDEPAVRELTSELLETLGYEVTAVANGAEALETYECALRRGENFHAVILDATIRGGMGGLATIERLRDLDPNITAIVCSGYSDEAALSEFLSYGFRGALPKPFTRHELANVLHRALQAGNVR